MARIETETPVRPRVRWGSFVVTVASVADGGLQGRHRGHGSGREANLSPGTTRRLTFWFSDISASYGGPPPGVRPCSPRRQYSLMTLDVVGNATSGSAMSGCPRFSHSKE